MRVGNVTRKTVGNGRDTTTRRVEYRAFEGTVLAETRTRVENVFQDTVARRLNISTAR